MRWGTLGLLFPEGTPKTLVVALAGLARGAGLSQRTQHMRLCFDRQLNTLTKPCVFYEVAPPFRPTKLSVFLS